MRLPGCSMNAGIRELFGASKFWRRAEWDARGRKTLWSRSPKELRRHQASDAFVEAVLARRAARAFHILRFCDVHRGSFQLQSQFFSKNKNLNSRFKKKWETDVLRSGGFPPCFLPIYSPFTTSLLACLRAASPIYRGVTYRFGSRPDNRAPTVSLALSGKVVQGAQRLWLSKARSMH